ncbi:Rha family transcriptional regulator [Mangrovibacter phragmitis]|uniref:Rha family transcriptional regulator n=1 Tax=Mangrovibacter phragmitis TaxID=1691903 RepID=UPI003515017A
MNNPSVIPAFDFREMVTPINGKVITTSHKVAQYFGKRHSNILRDIKRVITDCSEEFGRLNFELADYIDEQGKIRPMYRITKDGWMMLVMGFTGKAATTIKESYISAFNWMTEQLSRRIAMGEEMQIVDTTCDWVKPIYLTESDIRTPNRQTKKDVLAHNKSWAKNCQASRH